MSNKEFSIMPDNPPYWRNERFYGSERHEIFEGRTGNRKKSIEDGLVIFLTPEQHRTGKNAIHKNYEYWNEVKKIAEQVWLNYYHKEKEDFLKKYGRNYL
jgi:hypothetical protein